MQDTGKKYDHSMAVDFYGLSNDAENLGNVYYAILFVEDSIGHSLSFTVRLIVDYRTSRSYGIPFYAEYDCATHSIILSYQQQSYIKPGYNIAGSDYIQAYVSTNERLAGIWDNSVSYTKTARHSDRSLLEDLTSSLDPNVDWVNITGRQGKSNDEITDIVKNKTYQSTTEINGLDYGHYFERTAYVQGRNDGFLTLLDPDTNNQGEFSTQIRFKLDDNYAAPITTMQVAYQNDSAHMQLQFAIPLNFADDEISNTLNANRNYIEYSISNDLAPNDKFVGYLLTDDDYYEWKKPTASGKQYYYLQSFNCAKYNGESRQGENYG